MTKDSPKSITIRAISDNKFILYKYFNCASLDRNYNLKSKMPVTIRSMAAEDFVEDRSIK